MEFSESFLSQAIEIEGKSHTFRELLYIEETRISEEFAGQAGRYGYFGQLTMDAEEAMLVAKKDAERTAADAELDIRAEYKALDKKVTEGMIRAEVTVDDDVIKAQDKEIQAISRFHKLRSLTDAVRQRGDMMISLGATLRNELDVTNLQLKQMKEALQKGKMEKKDA